MTNLRIRCICDIVVCVNYILQHASMEDPLTEVGRLNRVLAQQVRNSILGLGVGLGDDEYTAIAEGAVEIIDATSPSEHLADFAGRIVAQSVCNLILSSGDVSVRDRNGTPVAQLAWAPKGVTYRYEEQEYQANDGNTPAQITKYRVSRRLERNGDEPQFRHAGMLVVRHSVSAGSDTYWHSYEPLHTLQAHNPALVKSVREIFGIGTRKPA